MAITTPIAYWKLDESSGNASDSIGSNTLTNINTATFTTGKINNGTTLVKASSQLFTTTTTPVTGTGDKTISCWVKANSFSANGNIAVTIGGQTNNNQISIGFLSSGLPSAYLYGGFGTASGSTLSTGTWYHLLAVYKTSGILMYVNGVLVATGSANSMNVSGTNGNFLGNYSNYDANFGFDGMIDEVGIWNVALTADEINKIYNAGRGNQYPFTENLLTSTLAYYKFDSNNSNDSVASYNGTDTSVTYGTGKIGNGAIFDAQSDKIVFSTLTTFPTTGDFTVNFWVNPSSLAQNNDSIGGINDGSNSWHINTPSGGNQMWVNQYNGSSDLNLLFDGTFTNSTWYMLTIVRSGSGDTITTYKNGGNSTTSNGWSGRNFGTASSGFKLGQARTSTSLPATYDELGVWSRALTSTEITQLYNSGSGLQYPFTSITSNNLSLLGVS